MEAIRRRGAHPAHLLLVLAVVLPLLWSVVEAGLAARGNRDPGWRERVEALGFTHALLPNDYSLLPALEQSGWRRTYRDATATLLAAPGH